MNKKILTLVIMTLSLTAMLITSGCLNRDDYAIKGVSETREERTDKPSLIGKKASEFFQIDLYFTYRCESYDSHKKQVGKYDGNYVDEYYSRYKIATKFHKTKKDAVFQDVAPNAEVKTKLEAITINENEFSFYMIDGCMVADSVMIANKVPYLDKSPNKFVGIKSNDGIIYEYNKARCYITNLENSAKAWLRNAKNSADFRSDYWACPIRVKFEDAQGRGMLSKLTRYIRFTCDDIVPIKLPEPGTNEVIKKTYRLKILTPMIYLLAHVWKITFMSGSVNGKMAIHHYRPVIEIAKNGWDTVVDFLTGIAKPLIYPWSAWKMWNILGLMCGSADDGKSGYEPYYKWEKPKLKYWTSYYYHINEV